MNQSNGGAGLLSTTQEHIDKGSNIIDIHLAIRIYVGSDRIDGSLASEQVVDEGGNIVDIHLAVTIHITQDALALLQDNLLRGAPFTLSTVYIARFHAIQIGLASTQTCHGVELVGGDTLDEAIVSIAILR